MPETPYIIKCIKCGVEFMAENTRPQRCCKCKHVDKYPKVYYKNRQIALTRDDNKCQCCGCEGDGQRTNRISVHHIDTDTRNNSPSNLITLCNQCHRSLHKKYTRAELRRGNIYKLFATSIHFGEFGKNLIYGASKQLVKKQFSGKPKLFFGLKNDNS